MANDTWLMDAFDHVVTNLVWQAGADERVGVPFRLGPVRRRAYGASAARRSPSTTGKACSAHKPGSQSGRPRHARAGRPPSFALPETPAPGSLNPFMSARIARKARVPRWPARCTSCTAIRRASPMPTGHGWNAPSYARPMARVGIHGLAMGNLACESQSSTSTGPSPVKCQVSLEAPSDSIAPAGGKASVAVSAPPECSWTASSGAPWITGLTPSSGQGSGRVEFRGGRQSRRHDAPRVYRGQQPAGDGSAATRPLPIRGFTARSDGRGCGRNRHVDGHDPRGLSVAGQQRSWLGYGHEHERQRQRHFTLRVAAGGEARTAAIVVAGQTVTLTQQPATSALTIELPAVVGTRPDTVSAAGGSHHCRE